MAWWRDARFGMFIHWGLYSVPAGEYKGKRSKDIGEWIMRWANIPRADYEKFAPQFNPVKFDADEWVAHRQERRHEVHRHHQSKHHDGFAMFDSAVTDYTIVKSHAVQARTRSRSWPPSAKKAGHQVLLLPLDHGLAPPGAVRRRARQGPHRGQREDADHPDQKAAYVTYLKAQLKELLTNYDPAVLWFDGEWMRLVDRGRRPGPLRLRPRR